MAKVNVTKVKKAIISALISGARKEAEDSKICNGDDIKDLRNRLGTFSWAIMRLDSPKVRSLKTIRRLMENEFDEEFTEKLIESART